MAPFMKSIDTAIMGRKTWDVAKTGGTFGPDMKSYVMSRTVKAGEQDGVTVTRQTPKALAADLVDELYLGVVPVLPGEGIPLFPAGFPQRDFKLTENLTFSRGLISPRYRRKR